MPGQHPFRQRVQKAAAGGTFDEVRFGPILENRLYVIWRVAVEDETSAPTGDIRAYVDGHGYTHWELEQESPAAATLYWENDRFYLAQGESLVARFTGATAGDVLSLYVEGWWMEPQEWMGLIA